MAERLEDYLHCPNCLDIFRDPVMLLPCSHNFCRACLQQWKDKGERSCPLCMTEFSLMVPPPNLALKNMCENLSRALVKSEDLCSLHQERLKHFCFDHRELVCHICRDSEIHIGHKVRTLDEIVEGARESLQVYNNSRENCNEQAQHIKVQRANVEQKITKTFEELHHFLYVEEEARLAAVWEEDKNKSRTMQEKIMTLDRQTPSFSNVIRSAEELLRSGNASSMKKFKTAMSRIQELPDKPELIRGGLLDEAKHVGNLKFKVWERMKETHPDSPIILDPNTAGLRINLSEDLNSLSWDEVQQVRPINPERFQWDSVLGCALDPGRHVWDVEVGENNSWAVGVMQGDPCLPDEIGLWSIEYLDGEYKNPDCQYGEWNPPVKVQRIRVEVDMNNWSLSFSEALTNTQLWKRSDLPDPSGNTKKYPYFRTEHGSPLKIFPVPPCVTTASN
nr:E3 ubiquitin-protein ligase TRIM35-like [Nerophis lumbriciformis]